MNTTKFRHLSKGLKWIFRVISILLAVQGIIYLVSIFVGESPSTSTTDFNHYSLLTMSVKENMEPYNFLATCILGTIERIALSYVAWQGSIFFSLLEKETSPFSMTVYRILRKIGLLLIAIELFVPFTYSIVLSFIEIKAFDWYIIAFSGQFMIGFVIYFMAEVIRYGVNLQQFSDDVV